MIRRTRRTVTEELEQAGRALSTAAVLFHTALASKHGLAASDTKALDLIARHGPMTAGELGARSGLAPASVTGLLDRLEGKGLVRRSKDPEDGRRVLIEMDPAASVARFGPDFQPFLSAMSQVYADFSVEELETILRFLRRAAEVQLEATTNLAP